MDATALSCCSIVTQYLCFTPLGGLGGECIYLMAMNKYLSSCNISMSSGVRLRLSRCDCSRAAAAAVPDDCHSPSLCSPWMDAIGHELVHYNNKSNWNVRQEMCRLPLNIIVFCDGCRLNSIQNTEQKYSPLPHILQTAEVDRHPCTSAHPWKSSKLHRAVLENANEP